MSYTKNTIPYAITMEPVTTQNGWYLIIYNNMLGIRKSNTNYYYTSNSTYHLNIQPVLDYTPNLIYLGEYKPVLLDSNNFSSLPLNINDNVFFVNQMTKIVYIKPKDIVIMIPQTMPYDFKLYERFTFAGNYNPYLNYTSTSNKLFYDIIPRAEAYKTPKVDTNQRHHIDPIENTLTEYPYPNKSTDTPVSVKQIFNIPSPSGGMITFLIPFLTNISSNTNSLFKTIESIVKLVPFYRIIIITNNSNIQLPENIVKFVSIVPYTQYVGRIGYENKLNMKIKNGYDLANFYNILINNLVKTNLFTIWNYNWELEEWNDAVVANKCFSVPNYYIYNNERIYRSSKYGRMGYILANKMKYNTTTDGYDISINGIGLNNVDNKIKVRGNFDNIDYEDRKCLLLYGNELEVKTFFVNINNNLPIDNFVQKIM
jgi:hypothetical protein